MTSKDDRAEFREHTRNQALALGQNKAAFEQALKTVSALDAYDYPYLWTWMGVPIIQLPADVMATQEVIFATRPDIIVETGVARGGSLIFMASMLRLLEAGGKVIGVDIDIRAHNRESIERSIVADDIILIEGGSTDATTLEAIKAHIPANARVMVVLDSDHSRDHVLAECRAYGPLVTEGCYMVVADTIVGHLTEEEAPKKRSKLWFKGDEPLTALKLYLEECGRFEPDAVLNGKLVLSSSPGGYLRCTRIAD
jgi:cephalosporin hydroxylase